MPTGNARNEARSLLRSAKVSPLRFTLLYLGIRLLFDLIRTALDSMTAPLPAIDPTMLQPDDLLDFYAALFPSRTPAGWTVLFVSVLISLLIWVLSAGYKCYCLGTARGGEMPYESLFDGFSFVGKVLGLTLLLGLLIAFGVTLFFVPGVVFFLMYRFAFYNLCADPSIGILTAMKRSRLQTDGRKLEILSLELSFLPLLLLALALETVGTWLLDPLLPVTLAGNLIYALCSSLLLYSVSLFLTPYRELSFAVYFLSLPQPEQPVAPSDN